MKKDFSIETVNTVLNQSTCDEAARRTPLHVDFSTTSNDLSAQEVTSGIYSKPKMFNAVGSCDPYDPENYHCPILDVNGGVQTQRNGSKAVLEAAYEGKYLPTSLLRDVLGDNGIDLELFPLQRRGEAFGAAMFRSLGIGAIALRAKEPETFEAVDSTTDGHGHLYIQQRFSSEDHHTLINELTAIGIVSAEWSWLTELNGMGIARAPWTEKEITHADS